MVNNTELAQYCADYLQVQSFDDYCPNGLQIEGKSEIGRIMAGVSANQALIDQAIEQQVDALFVHHGFFWKNEASTLTGIKKKRIKALLDHDINLFAYHLPLDAHPVVGNNIQLGMRLNIQNPAPIGDSLVWRGEVSTSLEEVAQAIGRVTNRVPQVFGNPQQDIRHITWCSGGAQSYIDVAVEAGADLYITGEVSEQIPAIAQENNLAFIAAGHHATERYGVQAFCQHLSQQFELDYQFVDIDNIV